MIEPRNSPNVPDPRLGQAAAHLEKAEYKDAHKLCLDVLISDPTNPEAFYLLGVLTAAHNNHVKACELFDRAIKTAPNHGGALAHKARCLIALNKKEEAVATADRAAEANPNDGHTLDTIGVVYSRAGLHERALPFYERALESAPENSDYHYNYGAALQFAGRMSEARDAYRRASELNTEDYRALAAAANLTKQTVDKNDLSALTTAFEEVRNDADSALHIGHALAKICEDLNRPQEAMDWLRRAKALKRTKVDYRDTDNEALFDAAADAPAKLAPGYPDAAPVFIVGMPRTGTTLVERILSSHSALTSAGELTEFGLLLKRVSKSSSQFVLDAETLRAAAHVDLAQLGEAYCSAVNATLGVSGRFIDKMPLNILYAPIILAALPNARVICVRRHPADTVLSNYRQLFATSFSYYNYAFDLDATARYYARFDRLVASYRETLPQDRFTEVSYEKVVEDIESEARRLLDFCGLEFEPACIEFHKNKAPVATASSVQVRQPLYSSSVGRWRRYRPAIDSALNILVDAGCLSPDELIEG